ncbi:DNA-binding protein [uncultured Eubacterium sp.]|uniref:DNA-binding protein n=1 Tax=uncultured Eubacterium sp. TaxID=165185 RepID=UPI00259591F4|nr:DNA-binding protein [uncultured Eubacterium sp.]
MFSRCIQILCGEGGVPGTIRVGSVWGIPEDAEKPADARIKNGKYIKKPAANEE